MNPEKTSSRKTGRTLVKDPVCNMDVDPATAAGSSEYKGQTYYFCSPGCVKRFNADPEKYLSPKSPAPATPKEPDGADRRNHPTPRLLLPQPHLQQPISWKGNCHIRLPHGP